MTPWLAALTGAGMGTGLFLVVREFAPTRPRLSDLAERFDTSSRALSQAQVTTVEPDGKSVSSMGQWATKHIMPLGIPGTLPKSADMDILGVRPTQVLGTKMLAVLAAIVVTVIFLPTVFFLPLLPLVVLIIAVCLAWVIPNLVISSRADRARAEFTAATSAFAQWISLARTAGLGSLQAVDTAASVASSWPFQRIQLALDLARYSHSEPWLALDELADSTQVEALHSVADSIALSVQDSANIAASMASRAADMRNAVLNTRKEEANRRSQYLPIAVTGLAVWFLLLIAYPILSSITGL